MSKPELQTRIEDISHRMLDVTNDIVETIGQRAALRAQARAEVAATLYGEIAAFTCRKTVCRRAHRCRGDLLACIERARAEARVLSGDP